MAATAVDSDRWLIWVARLAGVCVAAVVAAVLLGTILLSSHTAFTGAAARSGDAWARVPVAAREVISRDLGSEQRRFAVAHAEGRLITHGPGISATFGRDGAVVRGSSGVSLQLGLEAIGRGRSLDKAAQATPVGRSNTVSYNHSGIQEWYANGPLGLEQGFTVGRRVGGSGPLTLVVGRVPAGARAKVALGGASLSVETSHGAGGSLQYSNVNVTDANGRRLAANIAVSGRKILLVTDDAHARYPLKVDPTVDAAGVALTESLPNSWDAFGSSVAISNDGRTIVVGAPGHQVDDAAGAGAVYVFTVPASGWQQITQTAELTASDYTDGESFGSAVSVSADGSTIAVGAPEPDGNHNQPNNGAGLVYVFTEPATGGWRNATQTAELSSSDGTINDLFGNLVSVSGDGSTIVVGAPGWPAPETGPLTDGGGAAYVFSEPTSGGWQNATQTAELTASDGAANDMFGSSVGVSATGGTVAVGAPGHGAGQGAAYVFTEPASGGWQSATQTAMLTASDGATSEGLGASLGMSEDASTIVVGGYGGSYVFHEPVSGGWQPATQTAELTAGGSPVAVSGDGGTIVTAGNEPAGLTVSDGAVSVLTEPASGGWQNTSQAAELLVPQYLPEVSEAVSADGGVIVVGAVSRAAGTDGVMVFPPAPMASSPPTVSGEAFQGQTLTGTNGTWSSGTSSYNYQWEDCDSAGADCSPILFATGQWYTLTGADVGHTLVVEETGTDGDLEYGIQDVSAATSVVQGLSATSVPTIAGQTVQGQTLTETNASWNTTVTGYTYEWEDCDANGASCSPINGAHGQSYTLTNADVGHTIVVQETAANAGGAGAPVVSVATDAVVGLAATSVPTIAGQTVQGQTLTETNASWNTTVTGYTYEWEDCDANGASCSPINGAHGQSYTLTNADVGHTIVVQETAANAGGAGAPVVSVATDAVVGLAATSVPTIAGQTVQGQTLTETNASWSTTVTGYAYQWERCDGAGANCSPINGAHGQSYTLTNADAGHAIVVQETASNAGGTGVPASSAATAVVTPLPPTSSAIPTISGTPIEGNTLTASLLAWTNTPTSVSYQWEDCDSAGQNCQSITGATAKTYTLAGSDVGERIVVVETAANTGGSSAPAASVATPAVPESGPVGLEIDNGDYATNDPQVTIEAAWPAGTQSILISNNGGFRSDTQTVAPVATINWTLEQTGVDRLPKTVYVRFLGVGQDDINFTDDIILDETAPIVQSATLSAPDTAQASAARAPKLKTYKLRLKAKDQLVGICAVATNRPRSTSGEVLTTLTSCKKRGILKVSRTLDLKLVSAPHYVRVQNSAGDWSRWLTVKS